MKISAKRLSFTILSSLLLSSNLPAQSNQKRLTSIFAEDVVKPRMRVIIDNDFGGDPDGLFQLVHHLLSPSVEVRAIIGSHLKPGDGLRPLQRNGRQRKKEN